MAIRITQAGVALAVGIITLTALIVGGFFIVKNNAQQARRDEAIQIAQQNLEERSNQDDASKPSESDEDASEEAISGGEVNTEAVPEQEKPAEENRTEPGVAADEMAPTGQTAEELPQTGVADQLSSIMVLSLLTFSVASYVTSRRHF